MFFFFSLIAQKNVNEVGEISIHAFFSEIFPAAFFSNSRGLSLAIVIAIHLQYIRLTYLKV